MKERIKEFVILAKEHADSYDDSGTPIWFQMYNEKFAELILRECMWITANYPHPQTKLTAAEHIARHFGVE